MSARRSRPSCRRSRRAERRTRAMPILQVPNFSPALPEILIALGAMALLMLAAFRGDQALRPATYGAAALLVIAALVVLLMPAGRTATFGGAFVVDGFAKFFKVMVFLASAVMLLMSVGFLERSGVRRPEFPVLVALATIGMGMMVSSNDLI